jgi:hypothetical protein
MAATDATPDTSESATDLAPPSSEIAVLQDEPPAEVTTTSAPHPPTLRDMINRARPPGTTARTPGTLAVNAASNSSESSGFKWAVALVAALVELGAIIAFFRPRPRRSRAALHAGQG